MVHFPTLRDGALHTGLDEDESADTEITSSGAVLHTGKHTLSIPSLSIHSTHTLPIHTGKHALATHTPSHTLSTHTLSIHTFAPYTLPIHTLSSLLNTSHPLPLPSSSPPTGIVTGVLGLSLILALLFTVDITDPDGNNQSTAIEVVYQTAGGTAAIGFGWYAACVSFFCGICHVPTGKDDMHVLIVRIITIAYRK